jgi:hypothetical protein
MALTLEPRKRTVSKDAPLTPLRPEDVTIFKVQNRRSYAAICLGNLCEGNTPQQAFQRLLHPLRRMGFALPDRLPSGA